MRTLVSLDVGGVEQDVGEVGVGKGAVAKLAHHLVQLPADS